MKKFVLAIACVVAVVLIFAATRPDTFRIERSTTIKATPAKIYGNLVNLHKWTAWSPFEHRDSSMKTTYGGPMKGKGAWSAWEGKKMGKGKMEITEVQSPSKMVMALDFEAPMKAHNTIEFTLQPDGKATKVTSVMEGPNPYIAKVIHVFMSMDRMVGRDFESGLANLKAVSEK